jgi:hypothetical protein
MKKLVKLSALLLAVVTLFNACKKEKSELLNLVPKDATIFYMVDLPGISQKIKFDEIENSNFYQKLMPMAMEEDEAMGSILKEMIEEEGTTGINPDEKLYGFYMKSEKGEDIYCMILSLENKEKFHGFLTNFLNQAEASFESGKGSGFDFLHIDEEVIAAYDETRLMWFMTEQFNQEEAVAKLDEYFSQKSAASISSVADFQDFVKDAQDISVWFSTDQLGKAANIFNAFQENFGFNPEGNYVHMYGNFGEEDITISSVMVPNKEMQNRMDEENFFRNGIDKEIMEMVDAEQAYGVLTLALDPVKVISFLEKQDLSSELEEMASQMGMNYNDLLTAFNGDFVVALSGFESYMKETEDFNYQLGEYETKMKEGYFPSITLVAGLTNPEIFDKLIANMGEMIISKDGYYEIPDDDFEAYLIIKDNYLVVSTLEQSIINVKEGKINTNWISTKSIGNMPMDNSMFLFLNSNYDTYDTGMKSLIEKEAGEVPPQIFNSVLSKFDNLTIMGVENSGKIVLKLRNTEHNSLYTLFKLIDENAVNYMF